MTGSAFDRLGRSAICADEAPGLTSQPLMKKLAVDSAKNGELSLGAVKQMRSSASADWHQGVALGSAWTLNGAQQRHASSAGAIHRPAGVRDIVDEPVSYGGNVEQLSAVEQRVMTKSQASNGVQSVERAFDVLEIMAAVGEPIGLSELAAEADLPIPTIHRLVSTVLRRGYVRQLPNKQYALGPRLIRLGQGASQQFGPSSRSQLASLVQEIGETANMAVLDIDMAVYVAQVASNHTMRTFIEVGRRVHLHCTGVGKALLLQMPEQSVRSLIARVGLPRFTENSITDVEALNADIARSRVRGFAIDDGEQEIGVRCFAVPVPGAPIPTAISVSGPAIRLRLDAAERVAPVMQRAAKELSTAFQG